MIFFDIDTQLDFLYPAGALYVPGAETIVNNIAALNRFAAANGIPLISTMDAHAENDPEFQTWPPHCVAGTWGQQKPAATLLEKRVIVTSAAGVHDFRGAQQILLEKQVNDCFSNANLPRILDELDDEHCVVYGVVTEICVRLAVEGLLRRGRHVTLVTDAVRSLNQPAAEAFCKTVSALSTVSQITRCFGSNGTNSEDHTGA